MPLKAGSKLGQDEIFSGLGAGEVGEVYRALDTKLEREVAIKLLLQEVSSDADRLARSEREARVLASLNHPHIATIYSVETSGESTRSSRAAAGRIANASVKCASASSKAPADRCHRRPLRDTTTSAVE